MVIALSLYVDTVITLFPRIEIVTYPSSIRCFQPREVWLHTVIIRNRLRGGVLVRFSNLGISADGGLNKIFFTKAGGVSADSTARWALGASFYLHFFDVEP